MTSLSDVLGLPTDRPPRCLAIGAHPDDIEIGAGGTILRLVAERPEVEIEWVLLTGSGERAAEAERSARTLAGGAGGLEFRIQPGRDGYLPYDDAATTKQRLSETVQQRPDLVLVHRHDDAHQDHRFAAELAWQLFRWSTILEYEIPKWDAEARLTNLYVTLDANVAERKVSHLLAAFPSQADRDWFSPATFEAVLRTRGIESRAASGLAEGFLARKLTV
jgi:LmbE family N-acetylglucosaminyl deacetylase